MLKNAVAYSSSVVVVVLCRARAIEFRQQNQEAVGGFFSQIGRLYMVHHLWGERTLHHDCFYSSIIYDSVFYTHLF